MTRAMLTIMSVAVFVVLTGAILICLGLTGNALLQTNDRLAAIDTSLQSVKGHADPLTYQIGKVNSSLVSIEQSLQPLHRQADTLNDTLATIHQTLTGVDATVKSVDGHSVTAEGSLVPTARDLANTDKDFIHAASNVATVDGQAAQAVALLTPIEQDLSTISGLLTQTRDHLSSSCSKLTDGLPGAQGGSCH
jgi:hypothetical protein